MRANSVFITTSFLKYFIPSHKNRKCRLDKPSRHTSVIYKIIYLSRNILKKFIGDLPSKSGQMAPIRIQGAYPRLEGKGEHEDLKITTGFEDKGERLIISPDFLIMRKSFGINNLSVLIEDCPHHGVE